MKVELKDGGWAIKYTGNNKDEIEAALHEVAKSRSVSSSISWSVWMPGYWLVCLDPKDYWSLMLHKEEQLKPEWLPVQKQDGMSNFQRNIMKDWFIYPR